MYRILVRSIQLGRQNQPPGGQNTVKVDKLCGKVDKRLYKMDKLLPLVYHNQG